MFAGNGTHTVAPFTSGQFVTVHNWGTIDLTNNNTNATDRFVVQGNYFGHGGSLNLQTFLGSDGSPSDQLVINSGRGIGSTSILVTNVGGPGALTVANGILVVDATNGATTTAGAFSLGDHRCRRTLRILAVSRWRDAVNGNEQRLVPAEHRVSAATTAASAATATAAATAAASSAAAAAAAASTAAASSAAASAAAGATAAAASTTVTTVAASTAAGAATTAAATAASTAADRHRRRRHHRRRSRFRMFGRRFPGIVMASLVAERMGLNDDGHFPSTARRSVASGRRWRLWCIAFPNRRAPTCRRRKSARRPLSGAACSARRAI